MTRGRKETAAERDERIVAEAGPWRSDWLGIMPDANWYIAATNPEHEIAFDAARRILNRLRAKGRR